MKNIFEFNGKIDAASVSLSQLKKRDERFRYWQKWMVIGACFQTPNGQKHTIIGFDKWGNLHALPEGGRATVCHNLSSPLVIAPKQTVGETRQQRHPRRKTSDKIQDTVTVSQLRKVAATLGFPIRDGNRLLTKSELSAHLASRLGV